MVWKITEYSRSFFWEECFTCNLVYQNFCYFSYFVVGGHRLVNANERKDLDLSLLFTQVIYLFVFNHLYSTYIVKRVQILDSG